jgi:hypothetical protein
MTTPRDPLKHLHKATGASLKGKPVVGEWSLMQGRLMIRKFGGAWHEAPATAKRGPNWTILIEKEVLVMGQFP